MAWHARPVPSSPPGRGYPLLLDLSGRRVVVVGAGPVGRRRARGCAEAGAEVLVVAPDADAVDLPEQVRREARAFVEVDVDGAWLVHACTGVPQVDAAVARAAEQRGTWCVRADDATASAARVPAVSRHEDVVVAVSGGGDPLRAVAVRDALAAQVRAGRVSLRAHRARRGPGRVALVGGGPGDPTLLTVRGADLLAAADVVVADRLGPRGALEHLADDVEVVDVGKSPYGGGSSTRQEDIDALLVQHALAGRRVVRLKGGDPFVLGRGGEEALACVEAGVPVEVVPGVTSAVAVPALVGVPVTHRGLAQSFSVVSGHVDPGAAQSTVDWSAVARTGGTLVLLMAVGRLATVCAAMVGAGRAPATPVAVVRAGSTPQEEVVVATLADAADRAAHLGPPAVVVVGDVVDVRRRLLAAGGLFGRPA